MKWYFLTFFCVVFLLFFLAIFSKKLWWADCVTPDGGSRQAGRGGTASGLTRSLTIRCVSVSISVCSLSVHTVLGCLLASVHTHTHQSLESRRIRERLLLLLLLLWGIIVINARTKVSFSIISTSCNLLIQKFFFVLFFINAAISKIKFTVYLQIVCENKLNIQKSNPRRVQCRSPHANLLPVKRELANVAALFVAHQSAKP